MELEGGGRRHAPSGHLATILGELEQAAWNLEDATLRDGLAGQAGAFGFFGGVAQALGSVADAIAHGRQWLVAEFGEDRLADAAVASALDRVAEELAGGSKAIGGASEALRRAQATIADLALHSQ